MNFIERFVVNQFLKRIEKRMRKEIEMKSKSFRTTTLGIIGLVIIGLNVAVHLLSGTPVEWGLVGTAVTGALTGLFARDQKAHDEEN